jgi:hypothetical protein
MLLFNKENEMEHVVRMNLTNWNYFKPLGDKRFNKLLAKQVTHIEKYKWKFVEVENKEPKLVKIRRTLAR